MEEYEVQPTKYEVGAENLRSCFSYLLTSYFELRFSGNIPR